MRVLCPMLSPPPMQDCHQSTPSHCIPSPWHGVQQLMSLFASPAIHKTWHGMAQSGMTWHVSLWLSPSWGHCLAQHGGPCRQDTHDG